MLSSGQRTLFFFKKAMSPIWVDICILCFFQGLTPPGVPPAFLLRWRVPPSALSRRSVAKTEPGAGYDPERCDAGAWVSAAGCVRLFFGEIFVSSSRFFAEWRNKSFAGLRHNWGIAVHCYRNSLYPKPLNFLFSKIISLSPLKGNRALKKESKIKKKVEVVTEFVYATTNKKRV